MRFSSWLPLLLATTACVTTTPNSGGGGTVQPVTSGGAVGSTCPKEDQIGCAPGATGKVRCKNAAWVSDGACQSPETCVETKSGDVVTATQCTVPATSHTQRAILCAKASHCLSGSFATCMNPVPLAIAQKITAVAGLAEAKSLLYYGIDTYASCIATAKDCAGVQACVKSGNLDCTSNQGSCDGSKMTYCEGKTPTTVDCAQVGLPCVSLVGDKGSQAVCAKTSPCSTPKTLSCAGAITKACVDAGSTQNIAIEINCGLIGGTCDAAAKFDDDPDACAMPSAGACDDTTYVSNCNGNVRSHCKGGQVNKLDCNVLGMTCQTHLDSDGKPTGAGCAIPGSCASVPTATTTSVPTTLTFCDGAAGYASFDCGLAGMEFNGYECKFPGETSP